MPVIDFEIMEKLINEIEELFDRENLNIVEQDLIVQQIKARLVKKVNKVKAQDVMDNVSIGGLMKRMIGEVKNKDGET